MCLEFLCSWCHKEEDGPEHHGQSHRTSNGTDTWNSDTYLGRNDPPSKLRSEMPSNGDTYSARNDPPSKPHSEPYSGNKNPVFSGVAVNNGDTKRKDENPKTSSMVFNGDKDLKAVHPRPSALAQPQVTNNTVLAAPVQQPNLRRGADSNLMHTNNHYPTVGDGARRNGHMRKDEEEDDDDDDDDEEEEEVSKAAQTKNRRY